MRPQVQAWGAYPAFKGRQGTQCRGPEPSTEGTQLLTMQFGKGREFNVLFWPIASLGAAFGQSGLLIATIPVRLGLAGSLDEL